MYNHAPADYQCPICLAVAGIENDATWIRQADIFYRDDLVLGFIGSKFIKGNEGYPIVVPVHHYENLYDLPEKEGHRIMDVSRAVAQGLKVLQKSDGVTILQTNEPAGGQHAFHYHMHIISRFEGDQCHEELWKARKSEPEERVPYAEELRGYFTSHPLKF